MPGVIDLAARGAQPKMRSLDLHLPPVAKCRGLLHNARIIVAAMETQSSLAGRSRDAWLDFIAERERALVALCAGAEPSGPQCASLLQPLAERSWRAYFRRSRSREHEQPCFVVSDTRRWMHYADSYHSGHDLLDDIIAICLVHGYPGRCTGFDSPASAMSFETRHRFADGGLEMFAGNYLLGPHGAYIVGFEAFRWILGELGLKQPRRFKGEGVRSG